MPYHKLNKIKTIDKDKIEAEVESIIAAKDFASARSTMRKIRHLGRDDQYFRNIGAKLNGFLISECVIPHHSIHFRGLTLKDPLPKISQFQLRQLNKALFDPLFL